MIHWLVLEDSIQLHTLLNKTVKSKTVLFFKHSHKSTLSCRALGKLERYIFDESVESVFLNVVKHKEMSDLINERFQVVHEVPQLVVITKDGLKEVLNHERVYRPYLQEYLEPRYK